jgi:hypothetical protein
MDFEVGVKVKWSVGQEGNIINKGLYLYDESETECLVMCYDHNGRVCNSKLLVSKSILVLDNE